MLLEGWKEITEVCKDEYFCLNQVEGKKPNTESDVGHQSRNEKEKNRTV